MKLIAALLALLFNLTIALGQDTFEFIVVFKNDASQNDKKDLRNDLQAELLSQAKNLNAELWKVPFIITLPNGQQLNGPQDAGDYATSKTKVSGAGENHPIFLIEGSEAPDGKNDWLDCLDLSKNCPETDRAVEVAVFDTGIEQNHPYLATHTQFWNNPAELPNGADDDGNSKIDDLNGWDFFYETSPMPDQFLPFGHGTAVTGVLSMVDFATGSPAPFMRIVNLKIFDNQGQGLLWHAIKGIDYVIEKKIKIANLSWGCFCAPDTANGSLAPLDLAIRTAGQKAGTLFIAAAGNYATNIDLTPFYPASYEAENLIVVASVGDCEKSKLSAFSNWGPKSVDIAAIGENMNLPAIGNGLNAWSVRNGTSYSAPVVTASAAYIANHYAGPIHWLPLKNDVFQAVSPRAELIGRVATKGIINLSHVCDKDGENHLAPPTHFVENETAAQVFPNPFSEKISLHFDETTLETPVFATLFNAVGQVVRHLETTAGQSAEINTERLEAGFYSLQIRQGATATTHILIKN